MPTCVYIYIYLHIQTNTHTHTHLKIHRCSGEAGGGADLGRRSIQASSVAIRLSSNMLSLMASRGLALTPPNPQTLNATLNPYIKPRRIHAWPGHRPQGMPKTLDPKTTKSLTRVTANTSLALNHTPLPLVVLHSHEHLLHGCTSIARPGGRNRHQAGFAPILLLCYVGFPERFFYFAMSGFQNGL